MDKDIQVLFVDDEESIIDGIQRLFIKEPYGISGTTDVGQARQILEREKIKVLVSDHRMPAMLGVKFLQETKEKHPDVIRILFTGYTDFSAAEEAINLGQVYRFISKPWKTTELLATIRQAIAYYDLVVENRRLYEETRAQNEELEIANRKLVDMYQLQREFTSTVSHELRTPLASIKTAVDLVARKMLGDVTNEQKEVLDRAKRNVDRLRHLVDDILDLTKIESGKLEMNFQMNDINHVVQEVADSLRDVAQSRGLYLKTELDTRIPRVPFASDRIIQVLNNLLGNAIKFTKEGGITVTSQDRSANNHIVVSVTDTGKGIAEEDIPKLFQKFQQIESPEENEEGGTGLGLAICKEIITRHGGKVVVESAPGKGSTFSFILPIQERRLPFTSK
ncbi:MAG: hybrid sensor histidine kinase/response regulator [Candidatus Omnitrophica bacterium]|nr:hybrid sensor histidine kinase/response regulator [Candidatus Omnitrophota bacterium]